MADTPTSNQTPEATTAGTPAANIAPSAPAPVATPVVAATLAVTPAAAVAMPIVPTAPVHEVTLSQFALELSSRDTRVALIHGFVYSEKQARHFKDTEANYQTRYVAFQSKYI